MSKPHLPSWSWTHELWMRRSSPTISGVSLRGFRNRMTLPTAAAQGGKRHGRVGEGREEMADGRRRRQQEDGGKFAGEGAEQSEEHPAGAPDDRPEVAPASGPPCEDMRPTQPEAGADEHRGEQGQHRGGEGACPEHDLTANRVAA